MLPKNDIKGTGSKRKIKETTKSKLVQSILPMGTKKEDLIMPNDCINWVRIPLVGEGLGYEKLADLVAVIKSYSREAGFSIVNEDKTNHLSRTIRCSRAHEQPKQPDEDDDVIIIE